MTRMLVAIGADVAAVLLFVVLGRRSHDEADGLVALLGVAAPFLVGLAVGWLATPSARTSPYAARTGLRVWLVTVVVGLVLRRFVWDRGTALAFVLVATAFLGLAIVGWRLAFAATSRPRGAVRSSRPPLEAER